MKCPHCLQGFHSHPTYHKIDDGNTGLGVSYEKCPTCNRWIVTLVEGVWKKKDGGYGYTCLVQRSNFAFPRTMSREPVPKEVPPEFAQDYTEACLVLSDSPKASAALSRRCLQHLLRDVEKVKPGRLSDEIQELLDRHTLPVALSDSLDHIRNVGNFAAHPMKDQQTGDVVEVEIGEAEWNLDVLSGLFEHCFVLPAKILAKRAALNAKLASAGKPPMK